jgi:hypothetical protein
MKLSIDILDENDELKLIKKNILELKVKEKYNSLQELYF